MRFKILIWIVGATTFSCSFVDKAKSGRSSDSKQDSDSQGISGDSGEINEGATNGGSGAESVPASDSTIVAPAPESTQVGGEPTPSPSPTTAGPALRQPEITIFDRSIDAFSVVSSPVLTTSIIGVAEEGFVISNVINQPGLWTNNLDASKSFDRFKSRPSYPSWAGYNSPHEDCDIPLHICAHSRRYVRTYSYEPQNATFTTRTIFTPEELNRCVVGFKASTTSSVSTDTWTVTAAKTIPIYGCRTQRPGTIPLTQYLSSRRSDPLIKFNGYFGLGSDGKLLTEYFPVLASLVISNGYKSFQVYSSYQKIKQIGYFF